MDEYEEFFKEHKEELENRTGSYASYGRGFIIFHRDELLTDTIMQFNIAGISSRYAIGYWLLEYIVTTVQLAKDYLIFNKL